ncbi:MAG: ATP-dependent zinc metalloprotease FtsH [Phycisphaerae bacterium]|nr:ATP-dependent zinc metalloprotease FtsH [Phycisphaerae bacterium]
MSDNQKPDKLPPSPQRPQRLPQGPKLSRSLLGWVVIIGIGLLVASLLSEHFSGKQQQITITEFWNYVDNNDIVGTIRVETEKIEGELSDKVPLEEGKPRKFYVVYRYPTDLTFQKDLNIRLKNAGSTAQVEYPLPSWWKGALPSMLLMIAIFVAIWFFLFRRMSGAGGGAGFLGNFGRSKHRVTTKEQSTITFNDVAGIEDAKDEVSEIIEFLKNPGKFSRLGGRVPRGVLLVGEPGCGKTLLAKAIAGEADVPFFNISGSDFVEMFVGVGASRVRDLFKQAKDSAPCIIFLDEIDAVGRRRGQGFNGGGHDEREQTLNAILVEMDGFGSSDQVIVIAATNRSDVLDPALTRPGRFDRQVTVPLPDLQGRSEILKIYIDKIKTGPDVDITRMARGTPMFSGADLAALVNEAAIAAAMAGKDFVEQCDLEEARDKVRWGRSRKNRVVDEKEREITAYHEAGHAMVQCLLEDADPLHKVSIIPRGPFGGATFSLPEKDRYLYTRKYCHAILQQLLGGRVAEEIFCNDISSGASNDIAQATGIARKMVLDWGMSEKIGFVRYATDPQGTLADIAGKDYSNQTAEVIDAEIHRLMDIAAEKTRNLLEEHRNTTEKLAQALMKYETLSANDVQRIIDGKTLDKPTVNDLLASEAGKSTEAETADKTPPELIPLPEITPPTTM